jgi:6-phosphogluconolactonase
MSLQKRHIFPDIDALANAAAIELVHAALAAVAERGVFMLALAGGSTPRKLYTILANDPSLGDFPWDKTHLFFGDERHVPPHHMDSNYQMVRSTLLATGKVPEANIHRVHAELPDPNMAAADYDIELHTLFPPAMRFNHCARFDVILLGMGPDGHTASLFPETLGLKETQRWVVANWVEKLKSDRITFTYPVLNAARAIYLLVAGADKADMLSVVMEDPGMTKHPYPVQLVQPIDGVKTWFLDKAAAAQLPRSL